MGTFLRVNYSPLRRCSMTKQKRRSHSRPVRHYLPEEFSWDQGQAGYRILHGLVLHLRKSLPLVELQLLL